MALPIPVGPGADLFVEPIVIFEETYEYLAQKPGRRINIIAADKTIMGVIQTVNQKTLSIEADGQITDGTMMLHTRAILQIHAYDTVGEQLNAHTFDLQTFVRYGGQVWKVNELADWPVKTGGYNKYLLTKFTSNGGF